MAEHWVERKETSTYENECQQIVDMPDRYRLGENRSSVAVPTTDGPLPRVLRRTANIRRLFSAEWIKWNGRMRSCSRL
jgi:hypothetical protein